MRFIGTGLAEVIVQLLGAVQSQGDSQVTFVSEESGGGAEVLYPACCAGWYARRP